MKSMNMFRDPLGPQVCQVVKKCQIKDGQQFCRSRKGLALSLFFRPSGSLPLSMDLPVLATIIDPVNQINY